MTAPRLVIGTRASTLAQAQTRLVAEALQHIGTRVEMVIEFITTTGDRDVAVGEPVKGLFVKELEEALLRGDIGCAVHSVKDMPVTGTPGLEVAAILPRGDARDALVARTHTSLADLPVGAVVGTSSPRRKAQVLAARPDVTAVPLRGNVDTRLRKLDDGEYDAIVLAAAGLERLGLAARITERLDPLLFLPSPGQGALAVQIRSEDEPTRALFAPLNDHASAHAVRAEVACAAALDGGCSSPFGALATVLGETLSLRAAVLSPDGRQQVARSAEGPIGEPEALGARLAEHLLRDGAKELSGVAV